MYVSIAIISAMSTPLTIQEMQRREDRVAVITGEAHQVQEAPGGAVLSI